MSDLSAPQFHNVDAARAYLENLRWPDGRVCPHCGTLGGYTTKRDGVYRCESKECRKDFSVTVGTIFERSHIPLHKWMLAFRLLCGSKKGMSAHQLHRQLDVTYKTAWFMAHRIREAMAPLPGSTDPMGGEGKTIEADETYLGGKKKGLNRWGVHYSISDKMKVVSLVERGGQARSFRVDRVTARKVREIVVTNADRASNLHTDEGFAYRQLGKEFASHETVVHGRKEYVRGTVHTNTIEGFFSIFKRGMKGVYQHCGEQHLQRYLNEFDFRYNTRIALGVDDTERTDRALKGAEGKRLTYRRTHGQA